MSGFDGFSEERFSVNGTEIHARFGGDRVKPALLLLHGFPQTHAIWHRVAQAQCSASVSYRALPAGHFIPEELHQETAHSLRGFLG